jgi:hypothetical protein
LVAANTPLTDQSYVAILKAKQAELLAIQTTPSESFVALLEVPAAEKAAAVVRAWPHNSDIIWIQPLNVTGMDDDVWHADVEQTFQVLRDGGKAVVPVVTTSEYGSVLNVVRDVVTHDQHGLVIRLDCDDALEAGRDGLTTDLENVLDATGTTFGDCDVVIDAGLVSGGGAAVQASVATTVLSALPRASEWRSLVVAFSAFPELLGNVVAPDSVGSIPRTDAAAFTHLTTNWDVRPLTYADYGVGVPTYADVPYAPIPNIRYALDGEWRVHRARTRSNPSPQYVSLAQALAASDYFAGADFSPGDKYIADVANGSDGPGNAASYLKAAMSRHFHVVLHSLATRGVP